MNWAEHLPLKSWSPRPQITWPVRDECLEIPKAGRALRSQVHLPSRAALPHSASYRNRLSFHVGSQRKAKCSLERKEKKGLWPFHYLFLHRIAYKQVKFPHCRLSCKYCDGNKRKCPRAVVHSLHAQAKIFQPEKESVPLRTALAKAKLIKTVPSVCPRTASWRLSGLMQVTPWRIPGTDFF